MKQRIELEVKKSSASLADYGYGQIVYNEQVRDKIDMNKKIEIVFPDNIKIVASSFIQGFFEEFVKQIGIAGIEEQINIISPIPDLKKKIIDNLI